HFPKKFTLLLKLISLLPRSLWERLNRPPHSASPEPLTAQAKSTPSINTELENTESMNTESTNAKSQNAEQQADKPTAAKKVR
ncbi:hypothetical protein ACVBKF_11740, partial [Shewanella sp. 0m-11]